MSTNAPSLRKNRIPGNINQAISSTVSSNASAPDAIFGSNLQAWYRADSVTTTGSTITALTDKSGNGFTATAVGSPQLTTSAINGKSVITFTASDYFDLPSGLNFTPPYSIFALVNVTTFVAYGGIIHTINDGLILPSIAGGYDFLVNNLVRAQSLAYGTGYNLIQGVYPSSTATEAYGFLNDKYGSVARSDQNYNMTGLRRIGRGYSNANFIGNIAEIVVGAIPTRQQRIDIESYFNDYYNLGLT